MAVGDCLERAGSQACGSTALILQVSISEAMTAQFSAPVSWPAKRAFFLFRAMACRALEVSETCYRYSPLLSDENE